MADIWPSTADTSAADEPDPRVIGIDEDGADDLMAALSSDTAREVLAELHEEPTNPSALADRVDTSLQNVQYHLENLDDADLIEVIDTVYSEKGREMNVYAPADRPLVMFASPESERTGLRSTLRSLLGAAGVLALASVVVQGVLGELPLPIAATGGGGAGGGGPSTMSTETADAAGQAAGLPPGALFFLGGALVLVAVFAVRYWRG